MATRAGRACATQAARASGVLATRSTCLDPHRQTSIQAFETSTPTRTSPPLPCIAPPGSLRGDPWSARRIACGRQEPRLPFACQTATPAGPRWPRSQATNPRSESPPASPSSRWPTTMQSTCLHPHDRGQARSVRSSAPSGGRAPTRLRSRAAWMAGSSPAMTVFSLKRVLRAMPSPKKPQVKRVVLAYSGGLDTSIILKWLQTEYGAEVITFTADLGQGEELEPARRKAEMMGIKPGHIFIEDVREEFVRDCVFPMF